MELQNYNSAEDEPYGRGRGIEPYYLRAYQPYIALQTSTTREGRYQTVKLSYKYLGIVLNANLIPLTNPIREAINFYNNIGEGNFLEGTCSYINHEQYDTIKEYLTNLNRPPVYRG